VVVLLLLQDINWEKIRYMTDRLGLQAWHVNAPAMRPLVSACYWFRMPATLLQQQRQQRLLCIAV
jgi:hypothetical protein